MGCRLLTGLILTARFVLELTDGRVPISTVTINSSTIAVGSTVTLTCTVMLSPVMDIPTTVNTVWTGPAGFMTNTTAQPVMGSTTTYTSTATISSLGRNQSGVYNCTATVRSTSSLIDSSMSSASASTRVTVGVYLSLKGVIYPNNSNILITEIDQTNREFLPPPNSNNGLQCVTDRMPCCRSQFSKRVGEWFFPNRSMVPQLSDATTFYRNRGYDGTVNLNRLSSDVMMPIGRFCCIVPDATSTNVTVCANIVLELPQTTAIPTQGRIDQSVTFQLTSSLDSIDVSFSLTCNSTGGPVTSLIWKRDGLLLDNTDPLVLTDASTEYSYTNVLHVSNKKSGAYTCLARGPNDELLNSTVFNVQAASPPVNVKARQSSASAPVEVSWSPPSGGAATINGYRIFYHNQENIFVSSYVTSIVFNFVQIRDELGEIVSIRSESTQLPSEPVNVMVKNDIISYQPTPSFSTNVCIAVSLTTLIALAAVVLTTVIFFPCWLRKKRQPKKCEISIESTSKSYGRLKLEPGGGEYEDPDKVRSGPGNYEPMEHSANNECKQAEAAYITSYDTSR